MKLLLDQNLSHRLIARLGVEFAGSEHVRALGLDKADDKVIWDHAKTNGHIVVSKDDDFYQRSILLGYPPKVIWIQIGNCSSAEILSAFQRRIAEITAFAADPVESIMVIHKAGSLRG